MSAGVVPVTSRIARRAFKSCSRVPGSRAITVLISSTPALSAPCALASFSSSSSGFFISPSPVRSHSSLMPYSRHTALTNCSVGLFTPLSIWLMLFDRIPRGAPNFRWEYPSAWRTCFIRVRIRSPPFMTTLHPERRKIKKKILVKTKKCLDKALFGIYDGHAKTQDRLREPMRQENKSGVRLDPTPKTERTMTMRNNTFSRRLAAATPEEAPDIERAALDHYFKPLVETANSLGYTELIFYIAALRKTAESLEAVDPDFKSIVGGLCERFGSEIITIKLPAELDDLLEGHQEP